MEYLDICDSEGNLTGVKVSKKEAHDKGLWHRAVHIWILNSKNELLLQKRSPLMENHPNKWDISSAGHVSAGEDYMTSAMREVQEEIGLKLSPENFIQIGTIKQMSERVGYINNEINPVYIVKMDLDPSKIVKQKEEVSEVKFIPYKELRDIVENKNSSLSIVSHPKEYKLLFDYIENN